MGLRFQKRIKLFQGVFLCLSKGGVSLSIGNRNIRINFGKRGLSVTGSAPGTGLSWREQRSWNGISDSLRRPREDGGMSWRNRGGVGGDALGNAGAPASQEHFDRGTGDNASAQTRFARKGESRKQKPISKSSRLSNQEKPKKKSHRKPNQAQRRSTK